VGARDDAVNRQPADRIDTLGLDGGLGFVSNAAKAVMQLSAHVPHDARLLLREDLDAVIDKSRQSWGQAASSATSEAGKGVSSLVTSAVPLAATLTIGAIISTLFASNASIDQTLTQVADATRKVPLPDTRATVDMLSAKLTNSVFMMGAMTAALEIVPAVVATMVDPALQQAAGAAMQRVRDGMGNLPDLSGMLQQLTGGGNRPRH
jgi:hypothetical protein